MSDFDWSRIAIFIAAPRELSAKRFTDIVKHYLPKGDIVIGISQEEYVVGFENQPQFRMLKREAIEPIVGKVQASNSPYKIQILEYAQQDLPSIVANLTRDQRVLLVNGSWKYAFHNSESFKILAENGVPIKYISPFVDEAEAKAYLDTHELSIDLPRRGELLSEREMFDVADKAALQSYDYSFQTGVALGKRQGDKYEFITAVFNEVIPYQTYAFHHGNSRERHQSRPHDTNHYDTIHAEMQLLVEAMRDGYSLDGATLFINLLPCPNCARTLSQTAVDGIMYRTDHSGGYAKELLRLCGKKVRQIV